MLFQPFFPLKLEINAISCNKQTSKRINALSMTAVITFWPTEIDLRRNIKEFYAFTVVILKMAAIFVMGRICDGPISKNQYRGIVYLHTKFHACIIKPTILLPICQTKSNNIKLLDSFLDIFITTYKTVQSKALSAIHHTQNLSKLASQVKCLIASIMPLQIETYG